jgi:putative phage-type endonuclease
VKPIIHECEQRSPEWFALRAGRLTGSAADAITAKPLKSGGEPAVRRDLRVQLAIETLTGKPVQNDVYVSAAMQRGIDLEGKARDAYEAATGNIVRQTGFVTHPVLQGIGCSLDGDIRNFEGILEIKCPKSSTMVGYWTEGGLPTEYVPQVMHNMLVTGAAWCDFAAYDDRMPEGLEFFMVRVTREQLQLDEYEVKVLAFIREVGAQVGLLRHLAAKAAG